VEKKSQLGGGTEVKKSGRQVLGTRAPEGCGGQAPLGSRRMPGIHRRGG